MNWWEDINNKEAITSSPSSTKEWDRLFMDIAIRISQMSKCASRQIGALLVRDKQILSIGYNGSPANSTLCQTKQYCPRREKLNLKSGERLDLCPAQHAEENSIHNAAKMGVSTNGATLYCACGIPCQRCAGALINAGVKEVVCAGLDVYDNMASVLFKQAGVLIREIDGYEYNYEKENQEIKLDKKVEKLLYPIDHISASLYPFGYERYRKPIF